MRPWPACCARPARDLGEAGDLAQDVFVRLCKDDYRLLGQYDPARSAPATWLTVVARSVALDSVRRRRAPSVTLDDAPEGGGRGRAPVEPPWLRIPPGLLSPRQELILTMLYDRDMDPAEVGDGARDRRPDGAEHASQGADPIARPFRAPGRRSRGYVNRLTRTRRERIVG
ncbi:MAG: sigma-70 family RNA polymerase sigma factor [Pseudomonadota bacterium]